MNVCVFLIRNSRTNSHKDEICHHRSFSDFFPKKSRKSSKKARKWTIWIRFFACESEIDPLHHTVSGYCKIILYGSVYNKVWFSMQHIGPYQIDVGHGPFYPVIPTELSLINIIGQSQPDCRSYRSIPEQHLSFENMSIESPLIFVL